MPVETADDRLLMLADFGVSCTVTHQAGGTSVFTAIFDSEHQFEDAGGSVAFSISQPMITGRSADMASVVYGDSIVVTGEGNFVIRAIMPDGTGITELRLESQ